MLLALLVFNQNYANVIGSFFKIMLLFLKLCFHKLTLKARN